MRGLLLSPLKRLLQLGRLYGPEALAQLEKDSNAQRGFSRRHFMQGAAVGSAALLAGCASATRRVTAADVGDVVILGAGFAGLTASYTLERYGITPTIYEATDRIGGRVVSVSHEGVPLELGGEFVDTEHTHLLALIKTLGLELHDAEPPHGPKRDTLWRIGANTISERDLLKELVPLGQAIAKAREALPEDLGYQNGAAFAEADSASIADFLAQSGASEVARQLMEVAYVIEYGLEANDQSALNLVTMLDAPTVVGQSEPWAIFGSSDERWKLKGGNWSVANALAKKIKAKIHHGHALTAISETSSGRVQLRFANGHVVEADRVICTIPFSVLRHLELDIPLKALKRQAISELGYGANSKICVPVSKRIWQSHGYSGAAYGSGLAWQSTWDPHVGRSNENGILTHFLGGRKALGVAQGSPDMQARDLSDSLESSWPGFEAARQEGAYRAVWSEVEFAKGSYAVYKPRQLSTFGGVEGEVEGKVHFAGEHTSEFQGYMGGAVESGLRAASEILGFDLT